MTIPVVVGTGLVALDVVFRGHSKKPRGRYAGGTCGNVLTALRYLGWKAVPVARLSDDQAHSILEADLVHWGVDVRFLGMPPLAPTPIIIERMLAKPEGTPEHRFSWTCPCCGAWLPRYKPVLGSAVESVAEDVARPSVFFFDRPSRGALNLAKRYGGGGSLVVFEPSASAEPGLFEASIESADVVKYSDQRLAAIPEPRSKKRRIEIQTMGGAGLRYRVMQGRRGGTWHSLPAVRTTGVVDTAGAGDWCTAGFLARVGGGGLNAIESLAEREVRDALRYGQALSAWTCRFEGARGGMYERSREEFTRDIAALLEGADEAALSDLHDQEELELETICPACPTNPGVALGSDAATAAPLRQR